jgi:hypothetical protein
MSIFAVALDRLTRAVDRIRDEYQEMPCLSLTEPQAARLLWLDRPLAAEAMRALEEAGFLCRTRDGRFVRADCTTIPRHRLLAAGRAG